MSNTPINSMLSHFPNARRNGDGWKARCPAHDDREPSLSITEANDGRVLLYCHAGCATEDVLRKIDLQMSDLFSNNGSDTSRKHKRGEGSHTPSNIAATVQPSYSNEECTLAAYADYKKLPVNFLINIGLREISIQGRKVLAIPYYLQDGQEEPVRFRLRLNKTEDADRRFTWRKGSKPVPYGLWRIDKARQSGYVVRVEGESDCHTFWYHGIPAIGIPGASTWRNDWSEYFNDIPIIYDVVEPDKGGETWLKKLYSSPLRDRVHLVRFDGFKDASELHCADPDKFLERWQAAISGAIAWKDYIQAQNKNHASEAWRQCEELAKQPRILDLFLETLSMCGVAGEERTSKVIYLALTSRLLERPVSIAVKGPSSGGKSYLTERVLAFFPAEAYYALSAMSERSLAYSDEPLEHRFLLIYEAAGLRGDFATYLVRSLLSEGKVRYETVDKTKDGMRPRLIEREGPTGLLVTTTSVSLHPENETRMLSLNVTDTREQTRAVLKAIAEENKVMPDLSEWQALQIWLGQAERRVTIPFANALAEHIPPIATRLRRDFTAILSLIRAHALLHQAQRRTDAQGQVIAEIEDYKVVRELVADLVSEGLDATVPANLRATVEAVRELTDSRADNPTNNAAVARRLNLDKSTASRRVRVAIEKGYLRNLEDRKGREARLVCGEALPVEVRVLPLPEDLAGCAESEGCRGFATVNAQAAQQDSAQGCRVAADSPGIPYPSSTTRDSDRCSDCGGLIEMLDYELCASCGATVSLMNELEL